MTTTPKAEKTPDQIKLDEDCKKILNTKCYYEILKIEKSATQEEIKKAYKKLIIKYHPDKNKSELAPEAFKKISHVFQVLSNEEKKNFYDKYGPEEEVREKINQQQRQYQRYEFDEQDPFELFRMFFGGGMDGHFEFDGRVFRAQNQRRRHQEQGERPPVNRFQLILSQFLPLILVFVLYVFPYLFQSVRRLLIIYN